MPIQTHGFQVDVMPHYTPVDPSLVAFNPAAIMGGALQSIHLANELKAQKAFDQAQQELAATRAARILAQNATNAAATSKADTTVALQPKVQSNEALQLDANSNLIQPKAALAMSDINTQLDANKIAEATQQFRLPAAIATAKTNAMLAGDQNVFVNQHPGATTEPQRLALFKTQDEIASLAEDKARADRIKNAQAADLESQARERDAIGRAREVPKVIDPILELQRHQSMINQLSADEERTLATQVPDPSGGSEKISLAQYLSQTRGGPGDKTPEGLNIKNHPIDKLFGTGPATTPVPTHPEAEALYRKLAEIRQQRDALNRGANAIMDAVSGKRAALQSMQLAQPGQTPVQANSAFANPAAVKAALHSGQIDAQTAHSILVREFGFAP